jgi:recombination protein RecR
MLSTSDSLNQLVEEFARLPGIGRKTAQRLALYILKMSKEDVVGMARALQNVKERITYCTSCWNFTETDPCSICASPKRERGILCVVEEPSDVIATGTNEFRGLYHVLGALSPSTGSVRRSG